MGAGRKTGQVVLQNYPQHQPTSNGNPPFARNLRKKDLGSVIFGCKHSTYKECMSAKLFGLPASHFQYVKNITQGMPIFLFNYSNRTLHGIFEAISAGEMYVNRHAWAVDGQGITPFPAQVRVKIHKQCQCLTEDKFQPILADNYSKYESHHFMFELDKVQTQRLISLFSASPISPSSISLYPTKVEWGNQPKQSAASFGHRENYNFAVANVHMHTRPVCNLQGNIQGKQKSEAIWECGIVEDHGNGVTSVQGKSWSSLFKAECYPLSKKECDDFSCEGLSAMSEDEPLYLSDATCVDNASVVVPEMNSNTEAPLPLMSQATSLLKKMSSETNSDLQTVVKKLIQGMEEMKEVQITQTQKIRSLESELEEANSRLRQFGFHPKNSSQSMYLT